MNIGEDNYNKENKIFSVFILLCFGGFFSIACCQQLIQKYNKRNVIVDEELPPYKIVEETVF